MAGIKKIFQKMRDKRNLSTRPGGLGLKSEGATGIAAGNPGSNTGGGRRRPGRRNADTPLGPGRQEL